MLSGCHSSSKVIQAVYFILFERMANEGAGTSLDVDRAVSEAVARAMSTITDSMSSVIDTRLTDDEKRIIRSENRAARKAKEAKRKRTYRNRSNFRPDRPSASSCFQGANHPTSQLQFNRGEPHWHPHGVSNSR